MQRCFLSTVYIQDMLKFPKIFQDKSKQDIGCTYRITANFVQKLLIWFADKLHYPCQLINIFVKLR